MKKALLLIILMLITAVPATGSSLQAGAVFLMIFPGSRATSMGGAFSATEGDIFSTFYNDAALAFEKDMMLGLQHANWLPGLYPGMYYEYLSYLHPVGNDIKIAGAVTYLTTGETEANLGDGVNRSWITYDLAVKLSGIVPVGKNMGISAGMKYIYSFLAPEEIVELIAGGISGGTGQAWAMDASFFYKLEDISNLKMMNMNWFNTVKIGVSAQNIGPEINYVEGGESDPLPRTLRIGTSTRIFENETHTMNLNLEAIKILVGVDDYTAFGELWEDTWKAFGFEYTFNNLFSLRTGYFIDRLGSREGPTFGAGFQYKKFHFDISVDQEIYAFKTSNYRISAQYSF